MIGLQEKIIEDKISVIKLAYEIGIAPGTIWRWFNVEKVPKRYHEFLSKRLGIDKNYIDMVVNDIVTYTPRKLGFNKYEIRGNITVVFIYHKNEKYEVLIDTEDLHRLIEKDWRWHLVWEPTSKFFYVQTILYYYNDKNEYKSRIIYLHRFLLNEKDSKIHVDHRNHDPLNNCKDNLRSTSVSKNAQNRKGSNKNSKTGVRNVNLITKYNRSQEYWVQIMKNGKRYKWEFEIDQFDEACKFAEEKRLELFKEFAGES